VNNTNNTSARASFQHAQKMFFQAFRDKFMDDASCWNFVNQLKLTQGEIRLEVQLLATTNQFLFGVTPNQANTNNIVFNTERRLPLQDSICVNEYEFLVGAPASVVDTTWQPRSYGNQIDFPGAIATSLNSTLFGHGWFRMTVNNDVIIPYRGLLNHYYSPQTQETAALGAGSPNDQLRGAEDAQITAEPNFVLIGSKNNEPTINVPAPLTVGTFTRGILIMKGIYAQNSTVVS
jgi:hypothetical protein